MSRRKSGAPGLALWLALAALVVVFDQFTKQLILGNYQLGDSTYVTSFFNIVRAHNTGAAFSFLAGAGGWQRWFFVALAVAASLFIVWLLRSHPGQKLFAFSLSMILGGAVGNVIDRLLHGYVVDFLDFHWSFLSPMFYRGTEDEDYRYGVRKVRKSEFNADPGRYVLRLGFPDFPECPFGQGFTMLGFDTARQEYVWLVTKIIGDERLQRVPFQGENSEA